MNTTQTILENAKQSILSQSESIAKLTQYLTEDFAKTVQLIFESKGRLVVTGIGKSAIIAQKMVATFNSTGTPALYLHAAEAIHGDSGMIQANDIVLIISKSGESPEIKNLVQLVKQFGNTIIGMVGNKQSYLATNADLFVDTTVTKEACINNLAPTSSSTAQMVMGDIIAENVDIEGRFEGRIKVSGMLSLKSKAVVKGEVMVGKLSVEPGADFSASCIMKSSVQPPVVPPTSTTENAG